MDFTPELSAFQGTIISADNVNSFSKLTAKGGNEDKIKHVINTMLMFLEKENYIIENKLNMEKEVKMRKFALFLILNADIPVLQEMVDMEGIHLVVWTIPTIPKCLLSEMLWNLCMEKFVYEVIAFSCPQLALEVASSLIDNIKYFTPLSCLKKIKIISAACYRLICRLHFFNFENRLISNILTLAYNSFQRCLNYFLTPPNVGKLFALSKDEQYKFKGKCLHTFLSLIYDCIEQYTNREEFAPEDFNEIYLLTFKIEDFDKNHNRSEDILECLENCHIALLDKCKELVMDVSVDIFCSWSEFLENEKSMQQTVGELCYQLRLKLLTVSSICEHPIISMLQQIESKPVTYHELINNVDADTIANNIKNNINKDAWLRALIHRENLCHDLQLVQQLLPNLEVMNNEECCTLFRICQNYLSNNSENAEDVKLLAVKAFQCCKDKSKIELLEEYFADNCFLDINEIGEFNNMMTEIFNKLIASPDADTMDVLNVFVQSPQKVYMKIFHLAAENNQQCSIMSKIMRSLEKYSNYYYSHESEPCVISITKKVLCDYLDTDVKQQNFVKFVCELKNASIISKAKLLLLIIMPNLYSALLNKDLYNIRIHCQLLSAGYTIEELKEYRAPILAMLAQVLEVVRWKLDTYKALSPSTLETVLQLQTKLLNTYEDKIPENEANWLRYKLKNMLPINMYYYRKLFNSSYKTFVEYVSGISLNKGGDFERLAVWLSLMMCSSTQKEWCNIWDDLAVYGDTITLEIIQRNFALIIETEANNQTSDSWECIVNCFKSFIFVVRYKLLAEPLTNSKILAAIEAIATVTKPVKEECIEDIKPILIPLFAYMMERKNDYTANVAQLIRDKIKSSQIAEIVNKIFSNGTC